MALTHLVDTSVLKRLGHPKVRAVIEPLAAAGGIGRPLICDLEVGYSARTASERDSFAVALQAFDPVETSELHVHRALQVQRLLAARNDNQFVLALEEVLCNRPAEPTGGTCKDDDFATRHLRGQSSP